jgi:hypothetical protein
VSFPRPIVSNASAIIKPFLHALDLLIILLLYVRLFINLFLCL